MQDCELFDSSCDEYLRYAKSNRDQWENTGQEEVASMAERFKELEFEVKDNYNPIPDGRIFSPSNGEFVHALLSAVVLGYGSWSQLACLLHWKLS